MKKEFLYDAYKLAAEEAAKSTLSILESARQLFPERYNRLFLVKENPKVHSVPYDQDYSDKRKFGWDKDYDFNVFYDDINGTIIHALSLKKCKLNFAGEGEPDQKIICHNPKLFVNLLCHLQKNDIIFSDQKLTSIILSRCRNEKGELLNEATISTYLSDSEKSVPYSSVAKIIARLKRTKLSSD